MGSVVSSVLKPFAKIVGATPPRQGIPAGYESVETGTTTTYSRSSGNYGARDTFTQDQYDNMVAANAREQNVDTGGMYTPPTPEQFARQFTQGSQKTYEILPINRNDPPAAPAPPAAAPAPAAPSPSAPAVPAPSATTPVPRAPGASPAPPAGGVQPAQPAQPVTPATTTAITPRPVVSGQTATSAQGQGVSRRRGRNAFVRTASVGLASPAMTAKKTLLGG